MKYSHGQGTAKCARCLRSAGGRRLVRWLQSKCLDQRKFEVAFGHSMREYRGVAFCGRCSGWGIWKSAMLARPCLGKSIQQSGGSRALKALSCGQKPSGLTHWPKGP